MNIRACPFCGEEIGDCAPASTENAGWHKVRCNRCLAGSAEFRTKRLAINAWNMRNPPRSNEAKK